MNCSLKIVSTTIFALAKKLSSECLLFPKSIGKKIAETRLYFTPSSFDVNAKVSETLNQSSPRIGESKTQYNLGLDRNFRLGYKILENLTTNYTKVVKSDMDSFRNKYIFTIFSY